jgi:hypothetical protein
MSDAYTQLAKILRTRPEILRNLSDKMRSVVGHNDVIERIWEENNRLVDTTLDELGLPEGHRTADAVYGALVVQLADMDKDLYEYLDKPDLKQMAHVCGKLCETAVKLKNPGKGFFIKKDKAIKMLEAFPPQNLLDHFGYKDVAELIDKEGFAPVFASLRFAQDNEWMHTFFDKPYRNLTPDDFEDRNVELIVLDTKWLEVAEKFMKKKYHNVSHLKEYGIIFITPLTVDAPGETSRMFTLLLHYLNEVPFYSRLFRTLAKEDGRFISGLQSLLRGDVLEGQLPEPENNKTINIRIIQQYLAKHDENDFRLLEPHVNPEAEHWYRAAGNLAEMEKLHKSLFEYNRWQELDYAGRFFPSYASTETSEGKPSGERLVSFDLIDLVMSLVVKGEIKYLYHQEEALWNKIFIEYLGRDEMNRLINENIIKGYISL